MKVLQVGLSNNPGGVEAFVMNYYREVVKQGITFDFVAMYGDIAYREEIEKLGGRIYLLPNVKKDYFGYCRRFREILLAGSYDVVHVNMLSAANVLPLRLAKEANVKKILAHAHNASVPGFIRRILHYANKKKVVQYANLWVACGKDASDFMFGSKRRGQVQLLSNAVEIEKYAFSQEKRDKVRREQHWDEKLVIGHVGRFETQKNHVGIIEIFWEILKREKNAVLCLVGGGTLLAAIQKKAEEYGIREKIYFAGVQREAEAYLSAMDVFLFPSLFEGLPFAFIEAQVNGLPAAVSDVIDEDAVIMENVELISLKEAYSEWAKKVLKLQKKGRTPEKKILENVRKAHYDIHREAYRLRQLYGE